MVSGSSKKRTRKQAATTRPQLGTGKATEALADPFLETVYSAHLITRMRLGENAALYEDLPVVATAASLALAVCDEDLFSKCMAHAHSTFLLQCSTDPKAIELARDMQKQFGLLDLKAAAKRAKLRGPADPRYHGHLYTWLQELWHRHLRGLPLLKDVAEEYDAIFDSEADDAKGEEGVTTEKLEQIRERFNSVPESSLRAYFNGYRWRTTPPTFKEAMEYSDYYEGNETLDVVKLTVHDKGDCYATRRAITETHVGVHLQFPAGTPRAQVLAALEDLQTKVQRDWQKILDAEIEMAPSDAQ